MPRTVKEWIGKTENTQPPRSVKQRVLRKHDHICALSCKKIVPGDGPQFDHIIPLWKWKKEIDGEPHGNRETNLQPVTGKAHKIKTAKEATERAGIAAKQNAALGLNKSKSTIPHVKSVKQNKATSPIPKLSTLPRRQMYE